MKTLSPELVAELDCAGNQPVLVEHPRTHRVYVLVAADEMPLPSRSPSLSPNASWTEAMNARRFVLIDKQIEGTLSTAEAAELDGLQHDADAYLERVAPLPIAAMHDLHARWNDAAKPQPVAHAARVLVAFGDGNAREPRTPQDASSWYSPNWDSAVLRLFTEFESLLPLEDVNSGIAAERVMHDVGLLDAPDGGLSR